jgi:hypothetical protein|tara:strand:+ start:1350 stop:1670 length:321 start_codon:yes stop_codon:yes gene_type:complete
MTTPVHYRLGTLGRRLEALFRQRRPQAYETLLRNQQAGAELEVAERYFIDRMAQHNSEFVSRHPQPQMVEGRARWMYKREAYVNAEVEREMENWVINYPKVAAKIA